MIVNIQSSQPNFDYHFTVVESGLIGVYGISGSGKTSLLRSLAGFNDNVHGFIKFKNKFILNTKENIIQKVQRCAFMSQHPILFPHWSVAENLNFAQKHSGNNQPFDHLLSHLNCQNLLNKYPDQLSGGEKQRISFIRALLLTTGDCILYLDEPFSALDNSMRSIALTIMSEYKKNNLIYMISHNLNELYHYADEFLYIKDGEIAYQNSIKKTMSSAFNGLPVASKIAINETSSIIFADDVSIALSVNHESSIVHQINATICDISTTGHIAMIKLELVDDQILFAKISLGSLKKLNLTVNQKVIANFKANA